MPSCRDHPARAGFTLVELLTVMAVLAILAGIMIAGIQGAKTRSNIARAKVELAAISIALEDFKRYYGDYPQLGAFSQAVLTTPNAVPGLTTAQAKLFNCLTGVFGATSFSNDDRIAGPVLLDVGRVGLAGTLTAAYGQLSIAASRPPFKTEQNVALADPWGRPYYYYYKNAASPAGWIGGYVLYSVGPDGAQTLPINQRTGVFLATQPTNNADNIYAQPP